MRFTSRLGFDIFLLVAVAAFGVASLAYEARASRIPFAVAVVAAVLICVQGWLDRTASAEDTERVGWRWPTYTLLAVGGCVFLVWLVGYLIAVPVFAFASMVLLGRTGWKTALAVTAGLWIFVYVLLEILLDASLS